jgi:chromosome segregation ATPase
MKAQDEVTASRVSQIVSEKEPLTKEVVNLRKQVSDLQAKKDHDPEELAGLRATIKSNQGKLEALNLEKKSLLSSKALLHSQVQALEHALAQEARQAEILAESKLKQDANWAKIAAKQDDAPIQLRDLEKLVNKRDNAESSATKRKILAPHVLKIVDEYAAKKRESVRESAHALLKLANATDPNNFVGYRDYLRALFESVKNTPHDKRGKYRKLLDSLYDSMVTRTGKKLKEIKVEFRTVFTPTPEEVTGTTQNVASGSFSWWEGVKFDYWLFTRKARLNLKIAKSWFSSKFGGFSSWIRKWSPF